MKKDIFAITIPDAIELHPYKNNFNCDECKLNAIKAPLWRDRSSEDKVVSDSYEVTSEMIRKERIQAKIDRLKEEMDGIESFNGFYYNRLKNEYTYEMTHLLHSINNEELPESCGYCFKDQYLKNENLNN